VKGLSPDGAPGRGPSGGSGLTADERGLSLVEQLISLALLGILVVTLLYALSGATVAVGVVDEQVTALNLATSALESVRVMSYTTAMGYSPSLSVPPGYECSVASSVFLSGSRVITGLQWITATVWHNGRVALQIADLKADR
jgi:type II secretory pathway pseudopilin PulG